MRIFCPICSNDATFVFKISDDSSGRCRKIAHCNNVRCGHLFAIAPAADTGVVNTSQRHWEWVDERLTGYLLGRNFFNHHARILEVGSGPGYLMKAVKNILGNVHIACVEPSESYKETLRSQEFVVYNYIDEVVEKNFYTSIILKEVIEHLDDPIQMLKKIKSLLSKNGQLFVSTPCGDYFKSSPEKHRFDAYAHLEHIQFFTEHSLEYCLREAGFSNIAYCYVDSFYPHKDASLTAVNERTRDAYTRFLKGEQAHLTYFAS